MSKTAAAQGDEACSKLWLVLLPVQLVVLAHAGHAKLAPSCPTSAPLPAATRIHDPTFPLNLPTHTPHPHWSLSVIILTLTPLACAFSRVSAISSHVMVKTHTSMVRCALPSTCSSLWQVR